VAPNRNRADAVVSPKHRRFPSQQRVERRVPSHVGVEYLQQRFHVSAIARLKSALESLNVLLRNKASPRPFHGSWVTTSGRHGHSFDIAYPERPTASRAFVWSKKYSILMICPSRTV
jgi:hypothetical protein